MNELVVYEAQQAAAIPKGKNYIVAAPNGGQAKLERDVDFGVIPKTKQPSLYKAGAEKNLHGVRSDAEVFNREQN